MADTTKSGSSELPVGTAGNELTLSRWSRLKREAKSDKTSTSREAINSAPGLGNVASAERSSLVSPPDSLGEANPSSANGEPGTVPDLPSLTDVSLDSDFTPFMQAKVPEALRRQALKALFRDAHFNTMDGLDIYVDDYTKFEPISAADLEKLSAWKSIKNPLKQVVTPGGYAVDVNSEEGKAVLAAREALQGGETVREPAETLAQDHGRETEAATGDRHDLSLPSSANASVGISRDRVHERYGKRVGDFKIDLQPLNEPIPSATTSASPLTVIDAVDPR